MNIAIALIQAFLVLVASPMVSGCTRKIRAKMHTRKGPSILQDYYDIAKLFKRQDVRTKNSSFIHRFMPILYLAVMLLLAMGLPLFTQASPLPLLADIILVLYLLAAVRFFFSLASLDSGDAFAGVGGMRELILGVLVEPSIILALFVTAITVGSTNIGVMGQTIASGSLNAPIAVIIAACAFAVACYAELGKLPYDLAEAEQEIQEGPLQEYSGPSLAILKLAMPMRQIIIVSWFIAIFIPFGAASEATLGAVLLGVLIFIIKIALVFFICAIIENAVARVRYKHAGQQIWVIFGLTALALVFCLMGI